MVDYSRALGTATDNDSAIAKLLEEGGKYTECLAYCVLTSSFRKPGSFIRENQYGQVLVRELARGSTSDPRYIIVCETLSLTKAEYLLVARLHVFIGSKQTTHELKPRQFGVCHEWPLVLTKCVTLI